MATVAVAIVESVGGSDLREAVSSALEADRIVVVRLPNPARVAGGTRSSAPSADDFGAGSGKVSFLEADWGDRRALARIARAQNAADWLLTIDDSERLDDDLRSSLALLRGHSQEPGYFLVSRKIDLFGCPVKGRRARKVESLAAPGGPCLGTLEGSVVCTAPSSFSRLVKRINCSSDRLARARRRQSRLSLVISLLARPLWAFVEALREVGGGPAAFIYAVACGYGEVVAVAKAWEAAHALERSGSLGATSLERDSPGLPGYVTVEFERGSITALRSARDLVVPCLEKADPQDCFGEPVPSGGRGSTWIVPFGSETAVLRWYRRGGLVRYLLRDLYFSFRGPKRPARELEACVEARRRGLPAPEAVGLRIDRVAGPFFRAAILTRRAQGYCTAWEALCAQPDRIDRLALVEEIVSSVERMHEAGVDHRDLNLSNILARRSGERWEVCFVDFDRAKLAHGPVANWRRSLARRRMARSLGKLARPNEELPAAQIAELSARLAGQRPAERQR